MNKITAFIFILTLCTAAYAQKNNNSTKSLSYKAKEQFGGRRGKVRYVKLVTDVYFQHQGTDVYCDSALWYRKKKVLEAFGHVKIVSDSVVVTAEKLVYDGISRIAKLRSKVVYTDGENRLYTDYLDYFMNNKVAQYFNQGKLIDSANVLNSELGYYYELRDYVEFYNDVELIAKDYTLYADTLEYSTITKIAYTKGHTRILTGDSVEVDAKEGKFVTVSNQTKLTNSQIETPDYYIKGDDMFLDDNKREYWAKGNVVMTAKNEDLIITGDIGVYFRDKGISKVYGRPLMKRIMREDTLFLSADTMVSIESKIVEEKRLLAFNDVKIFRTSLQGVADSMEYKLADSTIFFYEDPILWSNKNQISADSINIVLVNNVLDHMNINYHSFIASKDTIGQYNQIKGRHMQAFFEQNALKTVDVDGNGESLYYALSEENNLLLGMNKIICSNMKIRMENNELSTITFYNNPEGQFIPPHELNQDQQKLEGFDWREDRRPTLPDVAPYYKTSEDIVEAIESSAERKALKEKKNSDQKKNNAQ